MDEVDGPNLHSRFRKKLPVGRGADGRFAAAPTGPQPGSACGTATRHHVVGYKYSRTCIKKENIKICTVANFPCVLSC